MGGPGAKRMRRRRVRIESLRFSRLGIIRQDRRGEYVWLGCRLGRFGFARPLWGGDRAHGPRRAARGSTERRRDSRGRGGARGARGAAGARPGRGEQRMAGRPKLGAAGGGGGRCARGARAAWHRACRARGTRVQSPARQVAAWLDETAPSAQSQPVPAKIPGRGRARACVRTRVGGAYRCELSACPLDVAAAPRGARVQRDTMAFQLGAPGFRPNEFSYTGLT
jgi:hypothetical protein